MPTSAWDRGSCGVLEIALSESLAQSREAWLIQAIGTLDASERTLEGAVALLERLADVQL